MPEDARSGPQPRETTSDGGSSGAAVSGCLIAFFLYDISDAIRLDTLRSILGAPAGGKEHPFRHPSPEYVRFAAPPLVESLPAMEAGGESFKIRLAYYEYGVVTAQVEHPFEGDWDQAVAFAVRWMNDPVLERGAAAAVRGRTSRALAALDNPYPEVLTEDYYVMHLWSVRDPAGVEVPASGLLERFGPYVAQIVRGEAARFSPSEQAEILAARMSYYENDLVVAGWSAALVYDTPEGAASTLQLLEYANTQLLEFRHYDAVLTSLLAEVYRSVEKGSGFLSRWRTARDADRLNTILLDIRELTERVDNSVKFLSDMFAARLYRMAASRIGVPDYRTLVDHKLQSAGELYAFFMDRYHQGRAFFLELMVVIILVIELVFFFRGIS